MIHCKSYPIGLNFPFKKNELTSCPNYDVYQNLLRHNSAASGLQFFILRLELCLEIYALNKFSKRRRDCQLIEDRHNINRLFSHRRTSPGQTHSSELDCYSIRNKIKIRIGSQSTRRPQPDLPVTS